MDAHKKIKKIKKSTPVFKIGFSIFMIFIFILLTVCGLLISWTCICMSKAIAEYDIASDIEETYEKQIFNDSKDKEVNDLLKYNKNVLMVEYIDKNGESISSIGNGPGKEYTDNKCIDFYFSSNSNKEFESRFVRGINLDFESGQFTTFVEAFIEAIEEGNAKFSDTSYSVLVRYHFSLENGNSIITYNIVDVFGSDMLMLYAETVVSVIMLVLIIIWNISIIINMLQEYGKVRKMYYTDVISSGYNMQFFYDKSRQILKRNKKRYPYYAIVDFGLEKYRNYCTCYGMEKGVILVRKLNESISKCIRKKELIAHPEKADFALLLGYDSEDKLMNRLNAIANEVKDVDIDWEARFRMGVYIVEPGNLDIECMFNYAGVALTACNDSTGPVCIFTDAMMNESMWENTVENDMQKALDNNEFEVYLQPKYSTKEEILSGAEALVRWNHPTQGFISPGRFIPIFEKNGFILKLDDFMISNVARQQAKWLSEGKKLVPISVNVSRAHFTRSDLAEHICRLVDEYRVPHEYIELEVTESSFFDDKEVLINTVKKLKAYGFDISMDDFGAGYSSLNSLKEIPLDVLKLDAEFFRGNDDSGRGDIIVSEAITLAKKLNMKVVAEGIETKEKVISLAEKDCDLIQGYYFARPMPISEFEKRAYPTDSVNMNVSNDTVSLKKEQI